MKKEYFTQTLVPIGLHRVGLINADTEEEIDRDSTAMLMRTLNSRNAIAFIGSGVSLNYNYPSWRKIIRSIAQYVMCVHIGKSSNGTLPKYSVSLLSLVQLIVREWYREEDKSGYSEDDKYLDKKIEKILSRKIGDKLPDSIKAELRLGLKKSDNDIYLPLKDVLLQLDPEQKNVTGSVKALLAEDRDLIVRETDFWLVIAENCRKHLARYEDPYFKPECIDRVIHELITIHEDENRENELLRILLDKLGIKRFITTNYDREVENNCINDNKNNELQDAKSGDKDDNSKDGGCSFAYSSSAIASLVNYGFIPNTKSKVFHLHGDCKKDGKVTDLVVAERDYQRIYLSDDTVSRRYRETFEAILLANPLFFVGVGMQEDDVLRPFRRFLSERRAGEVQRPVYALIPRNKSNEMLIQGAAKRRLLYARYGVKVIYYDDDKQDREKALVDTLNGIEDIRRAWWSSWRRKPKCRRKESTKSNLLFLHGNSYRPGGKSGIKKPSEEPYLSNLVSHIESNSVVQIVGNAGTGKGKLAYDLAIALEAKGLRVVVANLAFCNDFLNVLERFCEQISNNGFPIPKSDPIEDFFSVIDDTESVIILGSLDRVLYRQDRYLEVLPPENLQSAFNDTGTVVPLGDPIDVDISRFLQGIYKRSNGNPQGKGKIILLGNVLPATPDTNNTENICNDSVVPISPGLNQVSGAERLAKPLSHHIFTQRCYLSTLSELKLVDVEVVKDEIERILTATAPEHRPMRLVSTLLTYLEADPDYKGCKNLLRVLSYFHAPINECVLEVLQEEVGRNDVVILAGKLCDAGFLVGFNRGSKEISNWDFSTHPIVRVHFCHEEGRIHDVINEPHLFSISNYAHENNENMVFSKTAHKRVLTFYRKIMDTAQRIIDDIDFTDEIKSGEQVLILAPYLRAAFNLLRFNWSAVTIPRQAESSKVRPNSATRSSYDEYQFELLRLHNAVRAASGKSDLWDTEEAEDQPWSKHGVLRINELSWLYNESGVTGYCQGELTDAYSHIRAAQVINNKVDPKRRSYRYCTAELNLALIELDRGRLNYAKQRLLALLAHIDSQSDFRRTVKGYLGIVSFFQGSRKQATQLLDEALLSDARHSKDSRDSIESNSAATAIRYKRRASIFLRFRAEVRLLSGNKWARQDLDRSLAIAQAGNHPDLTYFNHIARARFDNIEFSQPSWELLNRCYEFAWSLGAKRMEIDVRIQQAETALMQGNGSLAYQLATKGLSIATAQGLELRRTNCLVLIGGALIKENELDEGLKVVDIAAAEARKQGYQYMLEQLESLRTSARVFETPSMFSV